MRPVRIKWFLLPLVQQLINLLNTYLVLKLFSRRPGITGKRTNLCALFPGRANIDRIVIHIIPEVSQLAIALETGAIDAATFSDPRDAARFEKMSGFAVTKNRRNLSDTPGI